MIVVDDFTPPITYADMEYIFDVPQSKFVKMAFYNEIKTKKIGRKIYVSIESIKDLLKSLTTDKKSVQRNIIKRKIITLREDKILKMSKIIKTMRTLNSVYKTNLKGGIGTKRMPKRWKSEDINLILLEMDNRVEFESLSIDVSYSEIKKIILEVREMDLVYYTDKMAVRLEELKLRG